MVIPVRLKYLVNGEKQIPELSLDIFWHLAPEHRYVILAGCRSPGDV